MSREYASYWGQYPHPLHCTQSPITSYFCQTLYHHLSYFLFRIIPTYKFKFKHLPPSSSSSCFPINISAPTSMLHFSHLPTSSLSTWPHCPHKVSGDLYFANSKIYCLVGTNLLDHSFPPEKRAFPDSGFLIFFYFSACFSVPFASLSSPLGNFNIYFF